MTQLEFHTLVRGLFVPSETQASHFQENYRFWNPNALALGGKTALLNQTQALKYI